MRAHSTVLWTASLLVAAHVAVAQSPTPIPGFVRCDIPLVRFAPSAIAAGDFNQDGHPDLALVDGDASQVAVLLTNKDLFAAGDCDNATTRSSIMVNDGATAIAAGNLNPSQARTLDLVVAVQTGAEILRGDGKGQFTADPPLPAGSSPQAVAINDVDGDGLPDIVVGNGGIPNGVSILYGQSGGTFEQAVAMETDGPITLVVAQDLNKDSFVDIAAGSSGSGKVTVFLQDRNNPRSFPVHPSFTAGVAPTAMEAGDFNSDGAPDLAVTSGGAVGVLTLFLNQLPENEAEPFVQETSVATGSSPSALGVDDFNDDFALDAVVANQGEATVPFFLGDDRGGLSETPGNCRGMEGGRCTVGAGPLGLVLADVDGDGKSDVVTANQDAGSISVLLSSQPAPTATPTRTATRTATSTPTLTGTATITATETATATGTATATATRTVTNTPTASLTPTPTPQCFGGVCVQGQGCANLDPRGTSSAAVWLLVPAALWLICRRGRRT
jgi:FG-GAP-like repeat/FG-GAP repeat